MKAKNVPILLGMLLTIFVGSILGYYKFLKKEPPELFKTSKPKRKSIAQIISASGYLIIKDPIIIGSLVSGTVTKLPVKENQYVKKGQLLAYIDPGTEDTDYQRAKLEFEKRQKTYDYLYSNFERQRQLYDAKQLSRDEIERLEKNLSVAKIELEQAQITLEKEKLNLDNREIRAVQDGFLTAVNITPGSGVSGVDVSTESAKIFEIAPNIRCMEAKLDIDESDIGSIKTNMPVNITVNTYPDRIIETKIRDIGFSPKKINGSSFYKATVDIHNNKKLLRPGMAIYAKIKIAEAKNALCVKGIVFQINPKALKKIAKALNFSYKHLSPKDKEEFKKKHKNKRAKFLWTKSGNAFVEKPVILGVSDQKYFEITQGINENDAILIDIAEEDVMEKIYKKWFKGPL